MANLAACSVASLCKNIKITDRTNLWVPKDRYEKHTEIGRILTVAAVLDVHISDRPYSKALPLEKARAYMKKNAGIEFDAEVVGALLDVIACKGDYSSAPSPFAKAFWSFMAWPVGHHSVLIHAASADPST